MHLIVPDETKTPVVIVSSKFGLMKIEEIQTANCTQQILPVRGIHDIFSNISFRILVTKFTEKPVVLHQPHIDCLGYRSTRTSHGT